MKGSCGGGRKMRRLIPYVFLIAMALQISSCAGRRLQSIPRPDVVLFYSGEFSCRADIKSYEEIAMELGLTTQVVDHRFINRRKSFFDKGGKRKFKVLILPGGEPSRWFEKHPDVNSGIECWGAKNILRFIKSGGSVIAICMCGSNLFSRTYAWLNPTLKETQRFEWDVMRHWTHLGKGVFFRFCGIYSDRHREGVYPR